MKNKCIYILGVIALIIASSCDILDLKVRTTLDAEQVYINYSRTLQHCVDLYGVLPEGFMNINGGMMASTVDEAEHTLETSTVQKFNTGSWNPYENPDDVWPRYYRGIRLANVFLVSADSVNLDNYRLDPAPSAQTTYKTYLANIKRWKYEARFLRAFYYFELVKRYGGVPIFKRAIPLDEDISDTKRNTLEECIKFIIDECDSAALNLPWNYTTPNTNAENLGRATRGAAKALKARVLLYAASDLFNTPPAGYGNPELVTLPTTVTRAARWQAAADAAQLVIDSAAKAPFALATDYRGLFKTFNNTEIIFTRRAAASNSFEAANFPKGFDGATGNSTTPSQNLVDAYEVKTSATTAEPFDWNNPAHVANIYNFTATLPARDPRLGLNVITNNSTYKGRAVEIWPGGKDGPGISLATKTGYYIKKYADENTNLQTGTTTVHSWIFIRFAEILLNYAEAINEADPANVALAKARVDQVRARTGVAMPPLPAGLTQAQMRDAIRHERQVEFAFEDQRPWDVRRWMLGATYLNVPLRGVSVTQTSPTTFTYARINVENRIFESKMYFYPIPQSELNILSEMKQNPGW
jgi:hypothetical protein